MNYLPSTLKHFILITLGLCGHLVHCQFIGGDGIGSADLKLLPASCAAAGVNPFAGGAADGHADLYILPSVCSSFGVNPFAGGISDGHADLYILPSVCTPSGVNIFAGGISDGHADLYILPSVCTPSGVNIYAGGISDGHADLFILPSVCTPSGVNIYAGGNSDGHSDAAVIIVPQSSCGSVVPVTFVSMQAYCLQDSVFIEWLTANEWNNKEFIIEFSLEGDAWRTAHTVPGKGNHQALSTYSTYLLLSNVSEFYLRIKQVDYDGQWETSKIIQVNNCPNKHFGSFSVLPNPGNGFYQLYYNSSSPIEDLLILDALGRELAHYTSSPTLLNLSTYPKGIYYIKIKSHGSVMTEKIIQN